jgi:hypothetical protein
LNRKVYIQGRSGTRYSYTVLRPEDPAPPRAGNYVLARVASTGATVLMAGETDNLAGAVWMDVLERAATEHRITHVLYRLNVTRVARQAELADLLAEHEPPLNGPREAPPAPDRQSAPR